MKRFLLLLAALMTFSFANSQESAVNNSVSSDTVVKDTLKLRELAAGFNAKQLNLTNAIHENPTLEKFLTKTDKQAIRSSVDYEYFVTMILLKQFELHITKFHQAFDLYSMKAGAASFIVQSFTELYQLPADTKGVKSDEILKYIAANEKLKNDPAIAEIVNRVEPLIKKPQTQGAVQVKTE